MTALSIFYISLWWQLKILWLETPSILRRRVLTVFWLRNKRGTKAALPRLFSTCYHSLMLHFERITALVWEYRSIQLMQCKNVCRLKAALPDWCFFSYAHTYVPRKRDAVHKTHVATRLNENTSDFKTYNLISNSCFYAAFIVY